MAQPAAIWLRIVAICAVFSIVASGSASTANDEVPYRKGDLVPVTCLNRTIETGEHITDSHGKLQYIPFPTCAETKQPLSLQYLLSPAQHNCTVTITDPFFHLLEFYIHNDVPMTCRLPKYSPQSTSKQAALEAIAGDAAKNALALGTESDRFVPLTVALAGTLQLSHLHIGNEMNVLVHTAASAGAGRQKNKGKAGGVIDSAAAYSVSAAARNTRVIIGDDLTFVLSVGWYDGTALPHVRSVGGSGGGGGGTFVACLFSAAVGAGLCYLWLRGVDVPKSMRGGLGVDRIGMRREAGLPKYNGYGYGVGTPPQENGYGFTGSGSGKRD